MSNSLSRAISLHIFRTAPQGFSPLNVLPEPQLSGQDGVWRGSCIGRDPFPQWDDSDGARAPTEFLPLLMTVRSMQSGKKEAL